MLICIECEHGNRRLYTDAQELVIELARKQRNDIGADSESYPIHLQYEC